jgi:hypothetical protein
MVHCWTKWGRRERIPHGRASWRGSGRSSRSPVAAHGEERGEVGKKERKKTKEESLSPNQYMEQGASLVGALQCPKGANEGGALRVLHGATTLQLDRLGHYCPWCPTIHLGRQDGWRPVLGSIYEKRLPRGPFVKNVFHKGQNKKYIPWESSDPIFIFKSEMTLWHIW